MPGSHGPATGPGVPVSTERPGVLVTVVTSRRCQAGPSAPNCPAAERVIGAVAGRVVNPERIRCRNDDRWTQATTAGEPPRVTTPLSPVPLTQPLLGPPVGKQHTINDWLPCPARQTGRGTPAEQRRGATPVPTLMAGSRSMGAPREPDPGLWQPRGGDHPGCGMGPIHPGAVPRWSRSAGRGDATAGSAADRPVDPVGRRRRFGSSVGGRTSVRPSANGFSLCRRRTAELDVPIGGP